MINICTDFYWFGNKLSWRWIELGSGNHIVFKKIIIFFVLLKIVSCSYFRIDLRLHNRNKPHRLKLGSNISLSLLKLIDLGGRSVKLGLKNYFCKYWSSSAVLTLHVRVTQAFQSPPQSRLSGCSTRVDPSLKCLLIVIISPSDHPNAFSPHHCCQPW